MVMVYCIPLSQGGHIPTTRTPPANANARRSPCPTRRSIKLTTVAITASTNDPSGVMRYKNVKFVSSSVQKTVKENAVDVD